MQAEEHLNVRRRDLCNGLQRSFLGGPKHSGIAKPQQERALSETLLVNKASGVAWLEQPKPPGEGKVQLPVQDQAIQGRAFHTAYV